MKNLSYAEIVELKAGIQEKKESAMRSMSNEDWKIVDKKMRQIVVDGKAPPKMKSRRRYEAPGFEQ